MPATLTSVQSTIQIADNWEKKGQPTWVANCLSSAVFGYLSIALSECSDAVEGVAWLESQSFEGLLNRLLMTNGLLVTEVEANRLPSSVIAGNYHLIVYSHAAWCLKKFELGDSFAALAERQDVGELGTAFWRMYARGTGALMRGEKFKADELRLRGQEKYWIAYVRLIEAACNAEPVDEAVREIDKLFARRNEDKNVKDGSYEIEGSAGRPVRWDFRRCGLLNYILARF